MTQAILYYPTVVVPSKEWFVEKKFLPPTLHCLIEDTCQVFSRTAFWLDAFYYTLDEHLKDQHVYYCTLDFDYLVAAFC